MSRISKYLNEIKEREGLGLSPKPIDNGDLFREVITNIFDNKSKHHSRSINFNVS